jgi:hypothetical protein
MGPKGRPDTKTNWSTVRRPQDELQLQLHKMLNGPQRQSDCRHDETDMTKRDNTPCVYLRTANITASLS